MSSTTFSSVWGFHGAATVFGAKHLEKWIYFKFKFSNLALFADHAQSFWSCMNEENDLLSLTNVFWIVCYITKIQNSLKHSYEGIYCLNKGLKVQFVCHCHWNLTDLNVFSSEWNPDDRERKTSLISWRMMPGPTADLVWDVGDGKEEDGPYLKKQGDDWLTMSKGPRAVSHKRPADRQQTGKKKRAWKEGKRKKLLAIEEMIEASLTGLMRAPSVLVRVFRWEMTVSAACSTPCCFS